MATPQRVPENQPALHLDDMAALAVLRLKKDDLDANLEEARRGIEGFASDISKNRLPAFSLPLCFRELDDLRRLQAFLMDFQEVWFVGMGGSSLGGRLFDHYALTQRTPCLRFLDCPDGDMINELVRHVELRRVGVVSISKSGSTIETLLITKLLAASFAEAGLPLNRHMAVICEKEKNPLGDFARANTLMMAPHDPQVGGRYSAFSVVSLLPASLAGLDVVALRNGAANVINQFMGNPVGSPAARHAVLSYRAAQMGFTNEVMLPYGERLRNFSPWWAQLWAESLGKGGCGTTPVAACGPQDQHSMLQLFADGPRQHLITVVLPKFAESGMNVDGLTPEALLTAQAQGTAASLVAANRPVRMLTLADEPNQAMGELLAHMMLATVVAAQLWGVNAFDQPAVEDSKMRTRAILES